MPQSRRNRPVKIADPESRTEGNNKPRAVYRLVQEPVSSDTIEALQTMSRLAGKGEIVGIAYAVMLKGRRVLVNTTGAAHRNPIFALGMVRLLDRSVSDQVEEGRAEPEN
jgi:hypothetical protein